MDESEKIIDLAQLVAEIAQRVQPTLWLTAEELAHELRLSVDHVRRMDGAGDLPAAHDFAGPSRNGGQPRPVKRWLREEIIDWARAGCPSRQEWEELKAAKLEPSPPRMRRA